VRNWVTGEGAEKVDGERRAFKGAIEIACNWILQDSQMYAG